MTKTLDIYVRAHGIYRNGTPSLSSDVLNDTGSNKNIALYFYSPHGSTLKGRAADLIFLWGSQLKSTPHLKYETDLAPILIKDVFETKSSPSDKNNFVITQIPNYRINWNPGGNWITGIMIVGKEFNGNKRYKRLWLPETILLQNFGKQDSILRDHSIRRVVYFDQERIQSLEQLIQTIKNPVSFLGESSKPYTQINIHWTMCREIEHANNIRVDLRDYKKEKNYVETLDREFCRVISDLKEKLDTFRPRASIRSLSLPIIGSKSKGEA